MTPGSEVRDPMSLRFRRMAAMCRHELRVLAKDPFPLVILIGMPLAVMAFLNPAFRPALALAGYEDVTGAEQAVPGMAVMFSFFLVGVTGFAFFREHGWDTWDRLRASPALPSEVMVGKVVPGLVMAGIQLGVLFVLGRLLFGLRIRGSVLAMVVVGAALAVFLVCFAVALVAVCRTVQQINAFGNIGAMLFAGLGGALTPITVLPGWARTIAPGTPSYWAMRGFRSVILDGGGVGAVLLPSVVLLGFAAGCALFAAFRFRFEEEKISWA